MADGDAVLSAQQWVPRRDRHRARVDALLGGYLRGRAAGERNPVVDFLFTYYTLTPGQLRRWHPGFGVTLTGREAREYLGLRGYWQTAAGVTVRAEHATRRRGTVDYVRTLMTATASRPAGLGCFGMHEWAMVYRADPEQLRHRAPLRLGPTGTDAVVEAMPLRCTHFDAFRFFTDPARPRNSAQLSRAEQVRHEQPGCVHAAMDLYKFTGKLLPMLDSELLLDAFELAYAARELDMRASPYDLTGYGYEAIPVETPAGRADYVRQQSAISTRSASIRAEVHRQCSALLERTAASTETSPGR